MPLAHPLRNEGGIVVLRGNLAPAGSVVKVTQHTPKSHRGRARVFNREEDAFAAVTNGEVRSGDVVVIRYEGPRGGPVAPEAALGGPLAALFDGDIVEIDLAGRSLAVHGVDIETRLKDWAPPEPLYKTGVLARYALSVSSASEG